MCAASRPTNKDPYSEVEALWRSVRDFESLDKAPLQAQPWRAELLQEPETDSRCRLLKSSGSCEHARIYEIDAPGESHARAYLWPGALGEREQRNLIFRTLRDWAKPPNRSNLWPPPEPQPGEKQAKAKRRNDEVEKNEDDDNDQDGAQDGGRTSRRPEDFDSATATPSSSSSSVAPSEASPKARKAAKSLVEALDAFLVQDPIVATDNTHGHDAEKIGGAGDAALVERLRWVVLGQQYDWSTRTYLSEDAAPSLPQELRLLASEACKRLQQQLGDENLIDMSSTVFDAAICNFYHAARRPSDRLGGHRDDVEADAVSPLVTVSLGLPCVFLLGGATREARPIPLLLRSGTLLILAGQARHLYHGVPTVLVPPQLQLKGRSPKRLKSALPPRLAAIYRGSAIPGEVGGLEVPSLLDDSAKHIRCGEGTDARASLEVLDAADAAVKFRDGTGVDDSNDENAAESSSAEAIDWLLARARMSFSIRSVGD
nr:nucleic acid dioxygenase ALKB [Crypthecodinium cohnii]